MKKIITIILAGILIFSSLGYSYVSEATSGNWFYDLDNHWAEESIYLLVNDGIIEGYPNGSFKPDNKITVAEFTTIVTKSLDIPAKSTTGEWYQGVIDSAMEKSIIREGEFTDYNRAITRGEIARIVVRALGESPSTGNTTFKDDSKIPSNINGFIKRASELKIINGYPDGSFKYDGNATRAEATTVIVNMVKVFSGETPTTPQEGKFIEPELVIFQNEGRQYGAFYFGVQIANIDEYSDDYMFKAECINRPELNTMKTWHIDRGTYEIDRTLWQTKSEIKSYLNQVTTARSVGTNLTVGDKVTFKITIKKGSIENSYIITGTVIEN